MNMLHNLCKFKSQTLIFIIRNYRTSTKTTGSSAFTISFLKNKCGLSGKSLTSASKILNVESSYERPESVLKFFQKYGFSQTQITKIISARPIILKFDPQDCIKSKLDFLFSITQSEEEVVSIVAKTPRILTRSLNNHLIPFFNFLNSFTDGNQNVAAVIKHNPLVLTDCSYTYVLQNIAFLQTVGVPRTRIVRFLTHGYGQVIGNQHDTFRKVVIKVKEMEFDPSSSYFLSAIQTLSFLTDVKWESRCKVWRSFGFSNEEIFSIFKKHPGIMVCSEKNIREKIEFYLDKLRWSPSRFSDVAAYILTYSLEKRIIPRCSVLQALASKNIASPGFALVTLLTISERKFLETYVTAYKDEISLVMDAYQVRRMGILVFSLFLLQVDGKNKGLKYKLPMKSKCHHLVIEAVK